ncbi:predicted protein [Botrytis cinerea T4]|uniref:Uncharacterized protein n=1 Tax=Botryotinia fuckeliana (strain T4) TaxID=999810 RepID=G2YIK1_BOTF4|nr:predicted protein [Botrytis cinerea T4]
MRAQLNGPMRILHCAILEKPLQNSGAVPTQRTANFYPWTMAKATDTTFNGSPRATLVLVAGERWRQK